MFLIIMRFAMIMHSSIYMKNIYSNTFELRRIVSHLSEYTLKYARKELKIFASDDFKL